MTEKDAYNLLKNIIKKEAYNEIGRDLQKLLESYSKNEIDRFILGLDIRDLMIKRYLEIGKLYEE